MLDQRLEEMDSLGVDMQLVTPTVGFYQYGNELEVTRRIARECNDEIAEIVAAHPDRFAGLATVPMQDPPSGNRRDGASHEAPRPGRRDRQ